MANLWYAGGLSFRCQSDCGACCTDHEDYAYVYLRNEDLASLARHLGITPEEFRRSHTEPGGDDLLLRMNGPDCPFLEGSRCAVYEARPVQCRTFPFWSENLATRKAWTRLSRFCPGIGIGERHGLLTIHAHLEARKR